VYFPRQPHPLRTPFRLPPQHTVPAQWSSCSQLVTSKIIKVCQQVNSQSNCQCCTFSRIKLASASGLRSRSVPFPTAPQIVSQPSICAGYGHRSLSAEAAPPSDTHTTLPDRRACKPPTQSGVVLRRAPDSGRWQPTLTHSGPQIQERTRFLSDGPSICVSALIASPNLPACSTKAAAYPTYLRNEST
jgi:hypothetical protein